MLRRSSVPCSPTKAQAHKYSPATLSASENLGSVLMKLSMALTLSYTVGTRTRSMAAELEATAPTQQGIP